MSNKLLVGYENIHRAIIGPDGSFETPVRVPNGRSIETELEYESTADWADNTIVSNANFFKGGKGTSTFLGLSPDEYTLLFGNKRAKGGYAVTEDDVAPPGAWLWEQKKKGSAHKKYTVLYNTTCMPSKTAAESIIDGKAEAKEVPVEFTVGSYEHTDGTRYIEFSIETDDPTVDQEQVANWFKTVQFPKDEA